MARTKEFDPDAALQAALELFWERGYEATSMSDLVARLGIAKASIYGTFGGKRDLFLAALDRYGANRSNTGALAALNEPDAGLEAVRAAVRAFATEAMEDPRRLGCLVTNSAVELTRHDTEVARRVEASWASLEGALESALVRARDRGELPEGREPRQIASFLLVLFQGLRVMGRGRPEPERIRAAATQALAVLE
ncbi:TetR/AcrR family transcriptional regulator [Allostreptomyces psammosilenae]|uniref:TetR/AcrR family transcriptional repressor of nem operon n=1 Tax=Allostreptomyces psammosilenae TaxID=1892865 RepID=A0A853A9M7_9ACTN|nr:TetR/AcrR family transcriptional regulator [Allostreptomyces psammosilenae]NYI07208.1 TetR/AcrR family transcriptional repressor of nem operon [Allostreptomyces psammosilenae]